MGLEFLDPCDSVLPNWGVWSAGDTALVASNIRSQSTKHEKTYGKYHGKPKEAF